MFADALNRSRESMIDLGERDTRWTLIPRKHGSTHEYIARWEPWVRSYLVTQESIELMEFETTAHRSRGELMVTLYVTGPSGPGRRRRRLAQIVRPAPAVFEAQVRRVLYWAELRDERMSEILAQIDHVNCFWGSLIPFHADRMRKTRELIDAAVQMAVFVEMRFKHELAVWRPADHSLQVQPMITTPGHGSLPSGHCTQAYVVYEVIKALMNSMSEDPACRSVNRQLHYLVQRIATNRVVAGVHFPVDNLAGRILGRVIGEYFVFLCGFKWSGWGGRSARRVKPFSFGKFDGSKIDGRNVVFEVEFDPENQALYSWPGKQQAAFYGYNAYENLPVAGWPRRAPVLRRLFEEAADECRVNGIAFDA